jgi:hypothetical protein
LSPPAAWRLESLGFRNVYDYPADKSDWMAAGLPTEGAAIRPAPRGDRRAPGRADMPSRRVAPDVRERARAAGWDACVVVNEARIVMGLLHAEQLGRKGDLTAESAMRPGPSTFRPHVPIAEMAEVMAQHDLPNAPVTTLTGKS